MASCVELLRSKSQSGASNAGTPGATGTAVEGRTTPDSNKSPISQPHAPSGGGVGASSSQAVPVVVKKEDIAAILDRDFGARFDVSIKGREALERCFFPGFEGNPDYDPLPPTSFKPGTTLLMISI